jgi:hypothetical protein
MNPVTNEAGIPSEQGILLNATIMVNRNDNSFPTALRTRHLVYQFFPFRVSESGNVTHMSQIFPRLTEEPEFTDGGPEDGSPHVPSAHQSFETTVGAMPDLANALLRSCTTSNSDNNNKEPGVMELPDNTKQGPRTEDETHSRIFYNHIKSIVSDSDAPE